MKTSHTFTLALVVLTFIGCSTDANLISEIDTDSIEMTSEEEEEQSTEDTTDSSESTDDSNSDDSSMNEDNSDDSSTSTDTFTTNLRTFIFGHSLIVHDPPMIPTPSNETTVPHWMAELSAAASFEYAVSGQYGFLPQHANLPPISQWGFDRAEGAWESDTEAFAEADFNSILLTAGNFIQYQPATMPYDGNNPSNSSPISATQEIFDWVAQEEPGTAIYIYENWPDMAGFLSNGVPASAIEFENYNDYTLGEFHNWWLAYHEVIMQQRPDLNVKMIPVGPILSKLLTETELAAIPFMELYEDDAPHGRPTLYFLASLVTYMAMYGTEAPANYNVPSTVHEIARDNYASTVDFIWNELQNFNDENGDSWVFQ